MIQLTRFWPSTISSTLATLRRVLARRLIESECGMWINERKDPIWGLLVVRNIDGIWITWHGTEDVWGWSIPKALTTLSSLKGAAALKSLIDALTMFVSIIIIDLLWATFSAGQSRFWKGCLVLSVFWQLLRHFAQIYLLTMVYQLLYPTGASNVTRVEGFSSLAMGGSLAVVNRAHLIDATGDSGGKPSINSWRAYRDVSVPKCNAISIVPMLRHRRK